MGFGKHIFIQFEWHVGRGNMLSVSYLTCCDVILLSKIRIKGRECSNLRPRQLTDAQCDHMSSAIFPFFGLCASHVCWPKKGYPDKNVHTNETIVSNMSGWFEPIVGWPKMDASRSEGQAIFWCRKEWKRVDILTGRLLPFSGNIWTKIYNAFRLYQFILKPVDWKWHRFSAVCWYN